MKVLVDTHCWLWLLASPHRFSEQTRTILTDPATELLLSVASVWEIIVKHALGKLKLPLHPVEYLSSRLEQTRTTSLPIMLAHVLQLAHLPPHHRDPFDRVIIAQALIERLPILTADRQFGAYEVELISI